MCAVLHAFSNAEGTIKWLLEDKNDRPRYRIRIAEVTPFRKKCATSATLLEVTSALLLEVSPKWLREGPPKCYISSRRESLPRSECDIAEVTSGSVAEVTPRSVAEVAHFFPTVVTSAIRMRYRRSNFWKCRRSHIWKSLKSDFTYVCRRYLEESFPIGKSWMKTYFIILSIFCIYFFYKGIARLYTRSLACRKFCWTMLFRSNTVDIKNLLITIYKRNRNKTFFCSCKVKINWKTLPFTMNRWCWVSPQLHAK